MISGRDVSSLSGSRGTSGFTLLEISLVILILVIAAGALVPMIGAGLEEQQLRQLAGDAERMVRTARTDAIRLGIVTRIHMEPQGMTYVSGKRPATAEEDEENSPVNVTVPKGTQFQIVRWGEERLRAPNTDVWLFQPSGITEPVKLRFARGESSISMAFAALTGEPEEVGFYFP